MGGVQEESGESLEDMNVIYWPHPEFQDGVINTKSLITFLVERVPGNTKKRRKKNIWHKGKPFMVKVYNKDAHNTITFQCILDIKRGETICSQCEQKEVTSGIQTEVADQVLGIIAS